VGGILWRGPTDFPSGASKKGRWTWKEKSSRHFLVNYCRFEALTKLSVLTKKTRIEEKKKFYQLGDCKTHRPVYMPRGVNTKTLGGCKGRRRGGKGATVWVLCSLLEGRGF